MLLEFTAKCIVFLIVITGNGADSLGVRNHGVIESLELEWTFKVHLVQLSCNKQGHAHLDHAGVTLVATISNYYAVKQTQDLLFVPASTRQEHSSL